MSKEDWRTIVRGDGLIVMGGILNINEAFIDEY
jgi:hypothetical protein